MLKFVFLLLFVTNNIQDSLSLVLPEKIRAFLAVSGGINDFGNEFYKKGVQNEGSKNLICSPLSASLVLAMTAYGAQGETQSQMRSGLKMPQDDTLAKDGYKYFMEQLNAIKSVDLKLANNIFLSQGVELKPEFVETAATSFKADLQKVDFGNGEEASEVINSWVEGKTNNTIKKMISKSDIENAAMVLINAVYFKGNWLQKFEHDETYPGEFHVDKETTKNVPMMKQTNSFKYLDYPDLDAKVLQLRYEYENDEDAVIMFIILPNEIDGLKKVEDNLSKINYQAIARDSKQDLMELHMPKFKIERKLDLKPVLKEMGMTDMFEDSANFKGIADSPPLKISQVMQKAFVEVDELGSKAAAATAIIPVGTSLILPGMTVKVDRPFHFAIVHTLSNTVLFEGHVIDPKKDSMV